MPIKVVCQCGASFAAKDEMAGKTVRCPKCQQPLKIPAPGGQAKPAAPAPAARPAAVARPAQAARPAPAPVPSALDDLFDEAGIGKKTNPQCPKCQAELKPNAVMCVKCGFDLQSGQVRQGAAMQDPSRKGHGEATDDLMARAAKQIDVDKIEERKNVSQGSPAYYYIFGLIALVAFATLMFTIPKGLAFFITGIAIIAFGQLLITYYAIRILIVAFYESAAQGLLTLFVPFYFFVYVILRWETTSKFFMKYLGGVAIQLIGGVFMGIGWLLGFEAPPAESFDEAWRRPRVAPTAVVCVPRDDYIPLPRIQGPVTRSFSSAV